MSGKQRGISSISAWNQTTGNAELMRVTPLQTIARMCWSCMGGHEFPIELADGTTEKRYRPTAEVRDCTDSYCWGYPYRLGHNPRRRGVGSIKNVTETPTQDAISASGTRRKEEAGVTSL